jgi:hypothetical protein
LSASVRAISEKARLAGLLVEKQQIEVVNTEFEPQRAEEVLGRILDRLGERAARALAEAFGLPFDLAAIMALRDSPNSQPGYSQRQIEEAKPLVNGRRRPIS